MTVPVIASTDIVSLSAQCSLGGNYGGTVNLINIDNKYHDELRWTPLSVEIGADAFETGGTIDTCFKGTRNWLSGVIVDIDYSDDVSNDNVTLKLKSYYAQLAKKPVGSYQYLATNDFVMADVAKVFGGIPEALFDFETTTILFYGVVNGTNILEELKQLASACKKEFFVQTNGILVSEAWKTSASSVDHVIPPEAIQAHNITKSDIIGPSRLRVRGAFVSKYEQGEQPLMLDPGGGHVQCVTNGIKQPDIEVKLRGLLGDENELKAAQLAASLDGSFDYIKRVRKKGGGIDAVVKGNATPYMGEGNQSVRFELTGRRKPDYELESANAQSNKITDIQRNQDSAFSNFSAELAASPRKRNRRIINKDKNSDENEPIQIEAVVTDNQLVAEFGVIQEEFENLYVFDPDILVDLAKRRFEEFKMQRHTWRLNTEYLPCLQVNQVVQFVTKYGTTITGLLSEISINSDVKSAKMQLTVESFEEYGLASYEYVTIDPRNPPPSIT